jgi:hypothetical protein
MNKAIFAAVLAAGLIAAPLPVLTQTATAQVQTDKKETKKETKAKKEPSAATLAMRERQKKCGAEWKEAKTTGKIEKGQKWPQFWSACNKRLKAAAK